MAASVDLAGNQLINGEEQKGLEKASLPNSGAAAAASAAAAGLLGPMNDRGAGAGAGESSSVPPSNSFWSRYCPDTNTLKTLPARIWAAVCTFFKAIRTKFFGAPVLAAAATSTPLPKAEPVGPTAVQREKRTQFLDGLRARGLSVLGPWEQDRLPADYWVDGTVSFSVEAFLVSGDKHLSVTKKTLAECLNDFITQFSNQLENPNANFPAQAGQTVKVIYSVKGDMQPPIGEGDKNFYKGLGDKKNYEFTIP